MSATLAVPRRASSGAPSVAREALRSSRALTAQPVRLRLARSAEGRCQLALLRGRAELLRKLACSHDPRVAPSQRARASSARIAAAPAVAVAVVRDLPADPLTRGWTAGSAVASWLARRAGHPPAPFQPCAPSARCEAPHASVRRVMRAAELSPPLPLSGIQASRFAHWP